MKSYITLTIGVDEHKKPFSIDLWERPHLLIGGMSGMGQDILINNLINNLEKQKHPISVKLLLIDSHKKPRLQKYSQSKHLLNPILGKDLSVSVAALDWCVKEMDRRYELLTAARAMNIIEYNNKAEDKLPAIIVFVQELEDLMNKNSRDTEKYCIQLMQMSRAVGIHLILNTVNPQLKVIPGMIWANVAGRLAFKTKTNYDSRRITGWIGAEKLPGKGAMIFNDGLDYQKQKLFITV